MHTAISLQKRVIKYHEADVYYHIPLYLPSSQRWGGGASIFMSDARSYLYYSADVKYGAIETSNDKLHGITSAPCRLMYAKQFKTALTPQIDSDFKKSPLVSCYKTPNDKNQTPPLVQVERVRDEYRDQTRTRGETTAQHPNRERCSLVVSPPTDLHTYSSRSGV